VAASCKLAVIPLVFLIALTLWNAEAADKVYQWKDASGMTHFTNNPLQVPKEYRVKKRVMKSEVPQGSSATHKLTRGLGEKLWLSHCSSCHSVGRAGKRPLASVVIDPVSHFARSPKVLSKLLRGAVDGRTTDMKGVNITDGELLEVTRYLIKMSKTY